MNGQTWFVCGACPPGEENAWPAASFRAWSEVVSKRGKPRLPISNACLFERYPRVYRACWRCGGLMYFHSKQSVNERPVCRACVRLEPAGQAGMQGGRKP